MKFISTQISIISPTFDIMEKAKGNLIVDGSQIHLLHQIAENIQYLQIINQRNLLKCFQNKKGIN